MTKAVEAIVVLALVIFSFFIGVKYSDSVKSRASWLFETKEEEVELPDLSNENASEATVDENNQMENTPAAPAQDTTVDTNSSSGSEPVAQPSTTK